MLVSNLVSFDQIKLEKVEIGIYKNDQLELLSGTHLGKHRHSLGIHPWPGAGSPLAPKHVCAVFCFFSAEYNLRQVSGTAGPGPFLFYSVEHYR